MSVSWWYDVISVLRKLRIWQILMLEKWISPSKNESHWKFSKRREHSGENALAPSLKIFQPLQKKIFCHVDGIVFFTFCVSFQKLLPTFKAYKFGTVFSKSIEVLISQCTTSQPVLKGGVPSNITQKLMKSYACFKLFVINSPLPGTVIAADQLIGYF